MPNTFVKIASVTVGSGGAASITLSSIPSTYTDLQLLASLRADGTFGNPWYDSYITFNSANLSWRDIIGLGSGTPSSRNDTTSFVTLGVPSSGATASTFGSVALYVPNYTSSSNKSASMDGVSENNATGAGMGLHSGLYSSSSAITSITITPFNSPTVKFAQHSTVTLYGIKKD
jgi:hypothetical protein